MSTSGERPSSWGDGLPFVFAHVGDLHITKLAPGVADARTLRRKRFKSDLKKVFAEIETIKDHIRFVYLPGDLAENAGAAEYDVLTDVLGDHPDVPVRLIPGDHDFAQGSIANFKAFRGGLTGCQRHAGPYLSTVNGKFSGCPPRPASYTLEQFYYEETIAGVKCLFLDLVTAGYGYKGVGLDFRLGQFDPDTTVPSVRNQMTWLIDQLDKAKAAAMPCAVFMHAYPQDLADRGQREQVASLFWTYGVRLVEMGHTHYNEVGHDGRTMYATARSVGQNEDGPVGYAVVAIDTIQVQVPDACDPSKPPTSVDVTTTSWRFKQLQQTLPFVLITSPADRRLATDALVVQGGRITVRALVFWDQGQTGTCRCRVDDGPWLDMGDPSATGMYQLVVPWPEGSTRVSVQARDQAWTAVDGGDLVDMDVIEPAPLDPSTTTERDRFKPKTIPDLPGSDAVAIRPWPEKGIRADQAGPNKKGHGW